MGDDSPRALVLRRLLKLEREPRCRGDRWPRSTATASRRSRLTGRRTLQRFAVANPADRSRRRRAPTAGLAATAILEAVFGDDRIAEAAALSARPPLDMRVNTLMATPRTGARPALSPSQRGADGAGRRMDCASRRSSAAAATPTSRPRAPSMKGAFEIQDEGSQIAAAARRRQARRTGARLLRRRRRQDAGARRRHGGPIIA